MSKDELSEALRNEGFNVGFRKGIPTIYINSTETIEETKRAVKAKISLLGYTQSFGICAVQE